MRRTSIEYQFVEFIPDEIVNGKLYISMEYATAAHRCCCGCGELVITPLGPLDWSICFNGESVSLGPSIGNWSFNCQSHYWISHNNVLWVSKFTPKQAAKVRQYDKVHKETHSFEQSNKNHTFVSGMLRCKRVFINKIQRLFGRFD